MWVEDSKRDKEEEDRKVKELAGEEFLNLRILSRFTLY
jgi:hypothetical protein